MQRLAALAVALLAGLALSPMPAAAAGTPCPFNATDPALTALPYQVDVDVGGATEVAKGKYAHPTGAPKAVVMVGHGWTGDVLNTTGYHGLLVRIAKLGAVAVAMDYRGPPMDYKVFSGAEDTAAAARDWTARCGDLPVILWGGSMGGHVSAWTVMGNPGLADYLVADIAPTNIPELLAWITPGLLTASLQKGSTAIPHHQVLAPSPCGGGTGTDDVDDYYYLDPNDPTDDPTGPRHLKACRLALQAPNFLMAAYGYSLADAQAGVPPDAMLARMADTSPALNASAWTGSGLRHAYLVYGSADTLIPVDHGVQFQATLVRQGVPSSLYVAAYRGAPNTACLPSSCKGFAGIAPATHYTTGETLVNRILAQLGTAGGPVVGVATPEDARVKNTLPASAPETGEPAVDGPLGDAYRDAIGPYVLSGYYPDP